MRPFRSRVLTLLLLGCGLVGWLQPAPVAAAAGDLPSPAGWPLAGSPAVVAGFESPTSRYGAGHRGIDLDGRVGESVLAVATGTVVFAGSVAGTGVVVVDHGGVRTTYQPVLPLTRAGDRVMVGHLVGRLTAGGHCRPNVCLHLGLLRGDSYLDPLLLLGSEPAELRLLPADARAAAQRRADARAATGRAAAVGGPDPVLAALTGPAGATGRHGFLRSVPGPVSSPFGRRFHPVLHVWKLHDGTDLAAACGTPIRAPADGVVVAAYRNAGYGNRLLIDHGVVDGRHVVTALNHAQAYTTGVGDHVRRGQVVGSVGATGLATGCHLHLMVWLDGELVDPLTWF